MVICLPNLNIILYVSVTCRCHTFVYYLVISYQLTDDYHGALIHLLNFVGPELSLYYVLK